MITFEGFRPEDGVPIYLQIIKYLKQGIVSGAVADGDELPSRRVLSALLGVNPNTVQKACRILEDEGILESRAGAKSYVRYTDEKRAELTAALVAESAASAALGLKHLGLSERSLENHAGGRSPRTGTGRRIARPVEPASQSLYLLYTCQRLQAIPAIARTGIFIRARRK